MFKNGSALAGLSRFLPFIILLSTLAQIAYARRGVHLQGLLRVAHAESGHQASASKFVDRRPDDFGVCFALRGLIHRFVMWFACRISKILRALYRRTARPRRSVFHSGVTIGQSGAPTQALQWSRLFPGAQAAFEPLDDFGGIALERSGARRPVDRADSRRPLQPGGARGGLCFRGLSIHTRTAAQAFEQVALIKSLGTRAKAWALIRARECRAQRQGLASSARTEAVRHSGFFLARRADVRATAKACALRKRGSRPDCRIPSLIASYHHHSESFQ